MSFIIYCDESVSKGKYYSDFYGGLIVQAKYADILNEQLRAEADSLGLYKEI